MNTFASRLRQGELLFGTMLTLPSPESAEIVSKCGFDWLFLDGEHGPASILEWQRVLQAVAGRCACILRVPSASEVSIKKALDIGASGIIVPMINSPAEAAAVVDWSRYPPEGKRGIGLSRAQGYGTEFANYLASANEDTAVILQIEHVDALPYLEKIVKVSGVDAIFVGLYDLSASMGKTGQPDDTDVVNAIEQITAACKACNMPMGIFGSEAESTKPFIQNGYSLICAGTDTHFVVSGAQRTLSELKKKAQ